MKYLKSFNENEKLYDYVKSNDVRKVYSKEPMDFNNKDKSFLRGLKDISVGSLTKNIYIGRNIYCTIKITKDNDEYYYVRVYNNKLSRSYYYKCDQLDGITQLLDKLNSDDYQFNECLK